MRGYWADHPITTSLLTGLALLFAAIFLVDEIIRRREKAKYRRLARQARNALAFQALRLTASYRFTSVTTWNVGETDSLPPEEIGRRRGP